MKKNKVVKRGETCSNVVISMFSGGLLRRLISRGLEGWKIRRLVAFTLAEVLITLAIIGVVAAMVIPTVINDINARLQKEQVRMVKYKLTQATDTMKSLELIGPYPSTEAFVNELKKHFKIARVCDNNHLRECWTSDTISTPDGQVSVNDLKNGIKLSALALGTGATKSMGFVTADGTPMILVYSPVCTPLEPAKTYSWNMR